MKIIFTTNNGINISIVIPVGEATIDDCILKSVPVGASYRVVEDSAIPTDRTFRDAWEATVDETWSVR